VLPFVSTIFVIAVVGVGSAASRRYPLAAFVAALVVVSGGVAAALVLFVGPRDLWLRHPWLVKFLHPYVLALDAILALAWGGALYVASASRLVRARLGRSSNDEAQA
jgi:hypothetical protein